MQDTEYKQEDKLLIQRAYRKLLKSIKVEIKPEDEVNIRNAYEMAVSAHQKQRRKSGEPYILHPIEVARICSEEIGLGPTAIIAALLHDVVEDTEISLQEIEDKFGTNISKIVDGLTKLDRSYNAESPQAENFRKVLSTLVEDVRVVLIKMADRLHNMRTIGAMPRHKQLKIASETSYIYAPLAHRLGLYTIKTEFQDLCMKVNEPDTYKNLAKKLDETKAERTRYINDFTLPLIQDLNELGVPFRITGRPKSIYSIQNKINTKNVSFEEIYDLFAVRIIVTVPVKREKATCWHVYSIVTDNYKPVTERLKDWITTPKSNGYESLHTTVIGNDGRFIEVQIRSERMDDIAERGFAAHWKYKGMTNQDNVYDTWLDNVRELLDNKEANAIDFINDFKTNLFNEEVYVYTPKGDLKVLPKGATALDFAFSIHTDIGYHCHAIKIDNRVVPMGYILKNGDQVSIETKSTQKPKENWLNLVVTGRAKSKIRSSMKEEKRKAGLLGKEKLQRKLKNMKVDFDENIDFLTKYYGFKSRVDFFYAITIESINLLELKKFKVEGNKLVEPEVVKPEKEENETIEPKRKRKFKGKPKLTIDGQSADLYQYSMATCCNPVMGDDIFAYTSTLAGAMKIHRTTCPNAVYLMANYGYRIMRAEWVDAAGSSFIADLKITGVDDGVGVIERLSHNISTNLGLNIRSFAIDGKEGYFEGKISLIVNNTDQLTLAIQELQKLNEINSVVRIEK